MVYFTVGQREQVAVFEEDNHDAKSEANDIVKMYSNQSSLVNITNHLDTNQSDTPYRLELVAAHYNGMLLDQVMIDLAALEQRVSQVEQRILDHVAFSSEPIQDLRDQLDRLKESLSLCGKNALRRTLGRPYWNRRKGRRKTDAEKRIVCEKFVAICKMTLTEEIRLCLRTPTFDNWQWADEEILLLMHQMYVDLDLPRKFAIDTAVLQKFLCQVYMNYNEVPFHNFQHCFTVSQMMYGIIWCLDLPSKIGHLETLILLTSCICHDLDHPGFNNIYQINARTELALRYNDISPLENHHCSVAFNILEDQSANLFASFSSDMYKSVREGIIRCILATDMARHNEILNQFNQIAPVFDYDNRDHINLLCMVLIKVADISNEARPMDVAEPWLECLLTEFYEQSDAEKKLGLPVTPFMDRDKMSKPSSQCSFIGYVLLPLFESIGKLYPQLETLIVDPVREALDYYRKLNDASKENASEANSQHPDENRVASQCDENKKSDSWNDSTPVVLFKNERNGSMSTLIDTSSNERMSSQEEIRRFSFGLDADTFTEVEVCEKTFSFKISTEIRPSSQWSSHSSAFSRRASLAVMSSSIDSSGSTSSRPASPRCNSKIIREEEEEPPAAAPPPPPALPKLASSTATTSSAPEPIATTATTTSPESRQSPMMTRLRNWTERLNPLTPDATPSVATPETSPFLNTRKMSHSLTRLFSRSFSMKTKSNDADCIETD